MRRKNHFALTFFRESLIALLCVGPVYSPLMALTTTQASSQSATAANRGSNYPSPSTVS